MKKTLVVSMTFVFISICIGILVYAKIDNYDKNEKPKKYIPKTVDDYTEAIDTFYEQNITFETKELEKRGLRLFLQGTLYNDEISLQSEDDLATLTKNLVKDAKEDEAFDKKWFEVAEEKYGVTVT